MAPSLAVLLAILLVGILVVEPGVRSSVAVIGALTLLAVPLATLLQRPGRRFPWVVVSLAAFLGLVVVGLSGIGPVLSGPQSPVAGNVVAGAVFGLLLASEVWVRASRPAYSGEDQDGGTGLAIGLCLPAAFGGAVAAANTGFGPSIVGRPWPLFFVGLALAVGGFALRFWAIATLGPMFQQHLVIQEHHVVTTDGPYRLVRHPSYTGPILILLGVGLVLDTWAGLGLCIVLPVAAYAWRITVEERMLVAGLGAVYEEYRERTWRLVPGVW